MDNTQPSQPFLLGLDDSERESLVDDFFERFAWDGQVLDPATTLAEEFLQSLLQYCAARWLCADNYAW